MSTENQQSSQNYSEEKYSDIYWTLYNTMIHAKAGTKFKKELANALARGYPIDFRVGRNLKKDNTGNSLLHLSLSCNVQPVITQILLDNGANINLEDCNGMNALHLACFNFRLKGGARGEEAIPSYFRELIEKTEDINNVPRKLIRTTPFGTLCAKFCNCPISAIMSAIKMLIDAGADLNAGAKWQFLYEDKNVKYHFADELEEQVDRYIQQKQQKENMKNIRDSACYDYEL